MSTLNRIFIIVVLLLLALPPLGLVGLRSFAKVNGYSKNAPRPTLSAKAFLDGRFQKEFAARHEQRMFGRNELLLLKNGIFDIANFGRYHAGYDGRVIRGDGGVLFEKGYINITLNPPTKSKASKHATAFAEAADTLHNTLAQRSIALGIVLAPSKADVCHAQIPDRFRYVAPANDGFDLYATLSSALETRNIPFVNGNAVCAPYANTDAAFPYSGTHWTVWAAAITATNLIPRINQQTGANLPVPLVRDMYYKSAPFTDTDRDLADLLNLPWSYRSKGEAERYAHFDFDILQDNETAGVILLGDSFCNQFRKALIGSGGYPKQRFRMYSNQMPTPERLKEALSDANVFILVYTSGALASDRATREMLRITDMLRTL